MIYIPRIAETTVSKYLDIFPCVAITGPRQSGKSTMLRETFCPEYAYVTFDNPLEIEFFENDPNGFFKHYSSKVIFDEVQKLPQFFNFLKIEIDNDRHHYGKYILTGSSQFAFIKEITESLAGRSGMLSLLPFQIQEMPEKLHPMQMLKGSYPEPVVRNYAGSNEWYGAYINNYIERDVRSLYNIGNLRDFQRLIMLLAARTSQELNMSTLSNELGVAVGTIRKWISVLEASYIIFLLPAYHKNLGKRIVKRPKLYFYDTGLVCYLTGISTDDLLNKGPMAGPVFENFIISELKKIILHQNREIQLSYFRSNLGLEVDVIMDDRNKRVLSYLEIKNSYTARQAMTKTISKLIQLEIDRRQDTTYSIQGMVLYRGDEERQFQSNIHCRNYLSYLNDLCSQ